MLQRTRLARMNRRKSAGASRTPLYVTHVAAFLVVSCAGCVPAAAHDETGLQEPVPVLPDSVFEHVETIVLEENDDVINVTPDVTVQADGSFLIADGREARIRIYDRGGNFVTQFGRKGEGPGEFGLPVKASRRPDGSLLVVDFSRGLLEFDSSGTRFLRRTQPPIMPLYDAQQMNDNEFLVAGLHQGATHPRPLMHIWDAQSDTVPFSFFPTPGDSLVRLAARNFGSSEFARRGDTIAAIAAFSDTIYLFDGSDYDPLAKVPLPMRGFKRMTTYDPTGGPLEFDKWLAELNLLVNIYWLEDRTLLVQYQQPRGTDNEWSLLHTTIDGRRYFDLRNTPKLLAVDGDLLFFVHPESYTPNKWAVVRLR